MPRHGGASQYHAGALTKKGRTRKSRKNRGRSRQSYDDKRLKGTNA